MMRKFATYALFIITFGLLLPLGLRAQGQQTANQTFTELLAQYQDTEGVNCLNLEKGEGLGIAKLAMRKYFGSKFLHGITQIAIIEYSTAPSHLVDELKRLIDTRFGQMKLQKVESDPEKGQTVRLLADSDGSTVDINDMIFVIESDKNRCIVYLHGNISKENLAKLSD